MGYRVLIYGLVVVSTVCSLSCRTAQVSTGDREKTWLAQAYRYDENGWIFLHTQGAPFERGFQRGYLTAKEIDEFLRTLAHTEEFQTGHDLDFFVQASARLFKGNVPAEYVAEMRRLRAELDGKPTEPVEVSAKERSIAARLITELEAEFNPLEYHDEYQAKLRDLIDRKARGNIVTFPAAKKQKITSDNELLQALEKSVKSLGKR